VDLSTVVGIVAAFALMIVAIMSGGSLMLFIDPASMMIVLGGTIGATLVHYPFRSVFGAMAVFKKTVFHQEAAPQAIIGQLIQFAGKARKEGILALESFLDEVKDPFFQKALQMAVDGQEAEAMKEMLDKEIEYIQERHESGADIFIAMGNYAPAMGMIGTLIGLVQMLQSMSDPSSIGPAMAVALLTTFYGSIIANILCLPIAGKLKNRSGEEILSKTLIAEGMRCVLAGENPRLMEQKLHTFVAPKLRESNFKK
jgi:chemotaxis protein MotA